MTDKIDDQGFLQRWSARKLDADRERKDASVTDDGAGVEAAAVLEADPQTPPADLPDVESLDAESDYTAFLGDNVPQDLAKLALRKLWRSDPVLANIDGLNDYDDDFSAVGMVSEAVKTVYKVGKGYLDQGDEVEGLPDETEAELEEDAVLQGEGDTAADEAGETPGASGSADLERDAYEEPCPTVKKAER